MQIHPLCEYVIARSVPGEKAIPQHEEVASPLNTRGKRARKALALAMTSVRLFSQRHPLGSGFIQGLLWGLYAR
jgi:hypothetical protein